jgi:putative transposase
MLSVRMFSVSRGSVYYLPRSVPEADLAIMRRLDRLHLEHPFAGVRMLKGLLAAEGSKIGRRHAKTLMRRMGIEALHRRPRTTRPDPGQRNLLRLQMRGAALHGRPHRHPGDRCSPTTGRRG